MRPRPKPCHFEKKLNPEWNQAFAFFKDHILSSVLEVTVKDNNDFIGRVLFDLNEVPKRVPPESPQAPQWYTLEDTKSDKVKGEVMLAVWMGTQADEVFPEAWHSDAAEISDSADGFANIRSKVYLLPKLWYLRVNVIEARDLIPSDESRCPKAYVKGILGNQALKTRVSMSESNNPTWNEDLMFVAEEPFKGPLILSVEDRVEPNIGKVLGTCAVPLQSVDRRLDDKPVNTRWVDFEKHAMVEGEKFNGKIRIGICLEGGYHVPHESTHYSSDLRPTAKELWKPSIGVMKLGILYALGLSPMKTKYGPARPNAYCVAKYGHKWVRTRTVIDCFSPKWNEQYTWEVFDPCTVVTIGVFNNCHLRGGEKYRRDSTMGKVRIRLSYLVTNRLYTHLYPLVVLHPSGVKKMGEIHLALEFNCSSHLKTMHMYSRPLLPKMHYIHPLTPTQLDNLRLQASRIVSTRLSQAEPPLRKEVVEYMVHMDSHIFGIRRSKANVFRIMGFFSVFIDVGKRFDQIRNWENPISTLVIHVLFLLLVSYPRFILPAMFLFLFSIGVWNFRWRPRHPPHLDIRLSCADNAHPDEVEEEFDTFPSSRRPDVLRMRYDRLRGILGRVFILVGNLVTVGEKLLIWRDPRATALFVIFCLILAFFLYLKPFQMVVVAGFYVLRPPWFRSKYSSFPGNFFKRLPETTECML